MVLQANRMARLETGERARGRLPARSPTARWIVRRGGIESKPGDHGKSMTVSRIDRDPFPGSPASVSAEFFRAKRHRDKAGAGERIGNGGGTIVGAVGEGTMAAAVTIGFCAQFIRRPNGALHRDPRVCLRDRHDATT